MTLRRLQSLWIFLLVLLPGVGAAEPITIALTARIINRCGFSEGASPTCVPFPVSVPVTVMFDPHGPQFENSRSYGPPRFSVPLELPDIPPDATRGGIVAHSSLEFLEGRFAYHATIDERFEVQHSEDVFSSWSARILDEEIVSGHPTLTPESLVAFLASGAPSPFIYGFQREEGGNDGEPAELVEALFYNGHVFLNANAPIPEPSTILLLSAAGLVGLRQRNRKRL